MKNVHDWLIAHTIWQNVIINCSVGMLLWFVTTKWKLIIAFVRVPPQAITLWVLKARLNAKTGQLRVLQRSHSDPLFAIYTFLPRILLIFLALALYGTLTEITLFRVLFDLQRLSLQQPINRPNFNSSERSLLIRSVLATAYPTLVLAFGSFQLLARLGRLVSYGHTRTKLLKNIRNLQSKLSDYESASRPLPEGQKPSINISGQKIRHPRYGEGTIQRVENDLERGEIVVVNFDDVGTRKFVTKFARFEYL